MYKIINDPVYGYLRVDPLPTMEEVERYYKEDFYSAANAAFNDSALDVQEKDKTFFNSRWERMHALCTKYLGDLKDKRIYDIGFGFAKTLMYFKEKGLICSGIEPSEEGVEYAQKNGIVGKCAGIEDKSSYFSDTKQDVVIIVNVLEHLRTPYETLVNIRKHLIADDGILIVDVPNEYNTFQEVANEEYKLNEWWLAPPKHINYFKPSALRNLLEMSGFTVVEEDASFPMELFLLFGDVYVGNNDLGASCHKKRVQFEYLMRKHSKEDKLNQFYQALASLELGRQIIMYARPKK